MLTLTVAEIRDLARFAGLMIDDATTPTDDELDAEFTIAAYPPEGARNEGEETDPDSVSHYRYVVYSTEYPEEGCIGIGLELPPPPQPPVDNEHVAPGCEQF